MFKKHLIPVTVFCIIFLVYALYFVKVVQQPNLHRQATFDSTFRSPETTVAPSISDIPVRDLFQKTSQLPQNDQEEPIKRIRYVNFPFLNLREEASTAAVIVEKLKQNDRLEILEFTNNNWVHVLSPSHNEGYVSRNYLSETPVEVPYSQLVRVPVFLYHHVTDDSIDAPSVNILKVKNFEVQLDYLSAGGWKAITFADLAEAKKNKAAPDNKSIILSFDDGYADHYNAAKMLKEKGMKGSFFLISGLVGQEGYLTWHQIREMVEWGMEMNSHGLSSTYLGSASKEQIEREVKESKLILEQETHTIISAFAYPSGEYTASSMRAVEEAGYDFARTMASGDRYNLNKPYSIPVLRIFPLAAEKQLKAWLD